MRAIRPYTNTDSYGNCIAGAKSYADAHGDIFTYRYTDGYSHINADRDRDANANTYAFRCVIDDYFNR